MAKVNDCSWEDARTYAEECMELWESRSEIQWTLDTSYLDEYKKDEVPKREYKKDEVPKREDNTNPFKRFK